MSPSKMPLLFLVCLLGLLGLLAARPLHAFRTNAGGICDTLPASIARMSTTRHGDNGNAGGEFTLSASSANGQAVQVTLSGVSFRGLVLAALDENGNHIGRFEGYPSYFEAQTRCEGPEGSVLQHNVGDSGCALVGLESDLILLSNGLDSI